MAPIERGNFEGPSKSAWNFEVYESSLERRMMERLEADPAVRKWTKRHAITIGWLDTRHRRHTYHPDFLVEYTDGSRGLIEVKDPKRIDSAEVQRKRQKAEWWCTRHGMEYSIETIE